jgi:hypothetical protein
MNSLLLSHSKRAARAEGYACPIYVCTLNSSIRQFFNSSILQASALPNSHKYAVDTGLFGRQYSGKAFCLSKRVR